LEASLRSHQKRAKQKDKAHQAKYSIFWLAGWHRQAAQKQRALSRSSAARAAEASKQLIGAKTLSI